MKRKTIKTFSNNALECIDLLTWGIECFGFNDRARKTMDSFFDFEYQQGEFEQRIKKNIASAYMAFLGTTNFRDRSDINNKILFDKILSELLEINEELKELNEER